MKTIYIYVNGILTRPGKAENWNGKAVTWTHIHTPYHAEKIEYYIGPISRIFGQKKRSEKLQKTMEFYAASGWRIILAGHSNGGNVICNALKHSSSRAIEQIEHIHLLAPATESDFDKNGLNYVDKPVTVYIGTIDRALRLSSGIGRLFGYGSLGKDGPKNVQIENVKVIHENFDHGDWFDPHLIDGTFSKITGQYR